jgi:arylsulfatase
MRIGPVSFRILRPTLAFTFAVVLLGFPACGSPADDTPVEAGPVLSGDNLVVVNIDSLRSDHLGCYGYPRNTSPVIDRLAAEGVVFDQALSNSSFTRESVATLLTGRLPTSGSSLGWSAAPSTAQPTLGQLFGGAGYRTGFFSNSVMLASPRFTRGFEEVQHLPERWGMSRMGPGLSARATEFLERNAGERFLLYLHYLDPHGPYDPPEETYLELAPEIYPEPLHVYGGLRGALPELLTQGFGPGDARFDDLVTRYDAEILDTDRAIGTLISTLERLGLDRNTLVVITADHGEEFLEHDFLEHAWTLYQESLRIPLILWAPGRLEAQHVVRRVGAVDLLPTLLELMGIDRAGLRLDGYPLLDSLGNPTTRPLDEGPFVAELMIRERLMQRTVIEGDWKYIASYRWLTPAERPEAARVEEDLRDRGYDRPLPPWAPVVREELYNLAEDPEEQDDLSGANEDKLREMRRGLDAYRAYCERHGLPSDGTAGTLDTLTPAERERLRALGYL